ncbi:hypothetical protein HY249_02455 [Candidatus Azambacteria bacterium]|nr:hypothetical protein [Candidatus Azambacteria bacterium]
MSLKFKILKWDIIRPTVIFVAGAGFILFGYFKIVGYTAEMAKLRNNFNILVSRGSSQSALKEQYEEAKNEIPKLEAALPTTDKLQEIADAVVFLAVKTNNIASVTLISSVDENSRDVVFQVNSQGSKEAFYNFLSELGAYRYFSEPNDFKISMSDGFNGEFRASFLLKVYLR